MNDLVSERWLDLSHANDNPKDVSLVSEDTGESPRSPIYTREDLKTVRVCAPANRACAESGERHSDVSPAPAGIRIYARSRTCDEILCLDLKSFKRAAK
jgi:hypothetical protein